MINRIPTMLIAISFIILTFSLSATTQSEIIERMKVRKSIINVLKVKGVLGENSKGYLEFKGSKEKEAIVNAENADRKLIYRAIAKKEQTTEIKVGRRRALKIKGKASAGKWFKDSKECWYQKK